MAILLIEPDDGIKITPSDLDLSKKQQETLLALWDRPKMASEIESKSLSIATVVTSLKDLKKKKMVERKKLSIKMEINGKEIIQQSRIDYWVLTLKGQAWIINVKSASKEPEIKNLKEKIKELKEVFKQAYVL